MTFRTEQYRTLLKQVSVYVHLHAYVSPCDILLLGVIVYTQRLLP